jgi:integrase
VVFSPQEAKAVIGNFSVHHQLISSLIYGAGLRLMEAMRLRVKDVDFDHQQLTIRDGKGGKDRVTVLPQSIFDELKAQIDQMAVQHRHDVEQGASWVYMPGALDKKYLNAGKELRWQYVFPSAKRSKDPHSDNIGSHHLGEKTVQNQVKRAIKAVGIVKHPSSHTFHHSFATHLLVQG